MAGFFDTYLVILLILITVAVIFVLVYQIVGEEEKVAG
jgi:hypothetical protein